MPAQTAFEYLSDGLKQSEWALGSLQRRQEDEHTFVGTSLFDGSQTFVRIDADSRRFIVIYWVGASREQMQPRNMVRVLPMEDLNGDPGNCLVTLLAWRDLSMSDARWKQLCVSHESEMFIIRSRLESAT